MRFKKFIFIFSLSFIIVSLFYSSLVIHIFKIISPIYTDASGAMFTMKHVMDTILSGNLTNLPNLPDFYGFKNTLFMSNNLIIHSILILPVYIVTKNIYITNNIFIFLTLLFSFYTTYLFIFYITKKIPAGILGAMIFVLNPFVSIHIPDSPDVFTLYWIPLIFLFFERFIKNKKNFDGLFFFVCLSMQLLSSVYYAIFLTVILPVYIFVRFRQEKLSLKVIFKPSIFIGLTIFLIITIFMANLYLNVGQGVKITRDLGTLSMYSPTIFNWFVAPTGNLLYGSISDSIRNFAPAFFNQIHPSEFSFFTGFIPLIMLIIGIKIQNKSDNKYQILILWLLLISFLLSLGPLIQFTKYLNFPSPSLLIFYINPLFNNLRVIGRFAVFVFFFLGIFGAISLKDLINKLNTKKAFLLTLIIIFLLFIEYLNVPLKFEEINTERINFYKTLKDNKDIRVVLNLPIGNRLNPEWIMSRNEVYDGRYFYWQMLHEKKLFNGNSSYLPDSYVERTNYISLEPFDMKKIKVLKSWGVDAIILSRREYKTNDEYYKIKKNLKLLNIPLTQETYSNCLFDLTKL